MTPLPWAMVPEFWSLPVIQRAGHHAAVVVLGLLIDAGRTMAGPGALPAEMVDPLRLARQMMLTEELGRAGAVEAVEGWLRDAVDAGALVKLDGGLWFGPGLWVDRRDVRRKLEADRKRAKRSDSAPDVRKVSAACPDNVRTMSADCPDVVQQRVEESRGEEIPPVVPPGTSPSEGTPSGSREGDGIDGDTLTRWRQAVGAGVILTSRQELALTTAWETYGATVTREAVAAALDWSVQAHGRAFRPEWLDERCAKLRAAKVREAPEVVPRGVQPVLDAFDGNRDHPLTAHQRGQVIEALKGETPSTLAALAVQVGGAGPVRVPASWLAAVLPEIRAKAAAEDAARERYAEADRQRAQEAEAFRRKMEDPAFRAERAIGAAKLKAALAEMGGDE